MIKTVKDLKEVLAKFDDETPVVICDMNDDGNGNSEQILPVIDSVDLNLTENDGEYVFININVEK